VPKFTLDSIITSPGVVRASISNDGKTLHIWKQNGYEELHVHTGNGTVVRFDNYILDTSKKDWITYRTPDGRDTVLAASSRHYKHRFVNMLGKYFKDEMGLIELPRPLKTIKGANISTDGTLILTWGESTEFPYTSMNRWDSLGISQGIPLIHDGIEGATLSADNGRIVSWESDTIMLWKKDTFDLQLPPGLIKMQTEVFTGVKMDTQDYSIKLIPMPEYIKRKRDFEVELEKYRKEKK
jgi:hypothetical protein